MSDLIWYRGRTNKATFAAKQDGQPLDLTGATMKFAAKIDAASTVTDINMTLASGITLTNTMSGIGLVTAAPSVTSGIANVRTILSYELQATLGNGEYVALDLGKIYLMPTIVT